MPDFDKSLGNIGQYRDALGVLQDVDNEFVPAVAPWNWEMLKAGYHIRVKSDFTAGQILEFEVDGFTLQLQPMALELTNDLDQIQPISMPQNVSPVVTNPPSGIVPDSSNGTITWENGYGIGRHYAWECTPRRLSKTLTIDSLVSLPIPEQYIIDGGNPVLRLNLIFDPPNKNDVDIVVDGQIWDQQGDVQTFEMIEFVKDGKVLWSFMPLMYWDSEGNEGQSVATLEKRGNKLYISIRVPYEWLQTAVYPVFIDADVAIETDSESGSYYGSLRSGPFWTDVDTGYIIYQNANQDLVYRKTNNGGANWAAAVDIVGATVGLILKFDCYADWQTDGDTGTKIHIVYVSKDLNEIHYVYLDTNDDSVGGDDLIEVVQGTGVFTFFHSYLDLMVSITKTRGGNIAVALKYKDTDSTSFNSFYTSPDADTWTSETSPYEAANDYCFLFTGNEADNQDIWAVYYDVTDAEISLKTYDDSENSWSEQAIGAIAGVNGLYAFLNGVVRLSDGHLIIADWNQYNNVASDLMVWDINGAGSIVAKTNIITNTKEYALVSVLINQINDDIYVAYAGGTDFTSLVKVYYQKSVDGGGTWSGSNQTMQADVEDDERWIGAGVVKKEWGGKFQPVWFNDDNNYLFTNTDNGISIAAEVGEQELTASAVAITSSVVTGTIENVSVEQELTASTVAVVSSVQSAAIAGSGNAPLTASSIAVASSVVSAEIGFILRAIPVAVTSSVVTASIAGTGSAPLTASAVAVVSSVVNAEIGFILKASPISVASSVQTSSVAGSGIAPLTASVVSIASSVNAALVSGSGEVTLTAAVITVSSSVQASGIAAIGEAPLTASPISVTSSVQQAGIVGTGEAPLTASPVAIALSVVSAEVGFILKASPVAVVSSVQSAAIAGVGTADLIGSSVGITSSVVQAGIFVMGALVASPVTIESSVVAAGISGSGEAPLAASPVSVTSSISQASISGVGIVELVASVVAVTSSVQTAAIWVVLILRSAPIQVQASIVAATISGAGVTSLFATPIPITTTVQIAFMVQILRDIVRRPAIYSLGRVKSTAYSLGQSLKSYTLGRRRR